MKIIIATLLVLVSVSFVVIEGAYPGDTGCNQNFQKMFMTSQMDFPTLMKNVCGPKDGKIIADATGSQDEYDRAMCRCDAKAQAYLSNEDRIPLDARCNCMSNPKLSDEEIRKIQYKSWGMGETPMMQ